VHKFAQKIAAGETITLYGDGSSERDYTHVDDVVDGVLLALDHAGGHHVYNLGAGRPVKLSDMVRIVGEALGIAPRIEVAPRQAGDVDATLADVSRARRELGFWPKRTLEQAAEELVRWMRAEALIT
jgi:UDP-glucuronate 4-epimerase